MLRKDANNLAGRFSKVSAPGKPLVVGCLGSLHATKLTEEEVRFIAWFYSTGKFDYVHSKVLDTYDGSTQPVGNFNDFIAIEVE